MAVHLANVTLDGEDPIKASASWSGAWWFFIDCVA